MRKLFFKEPEQLLVAEKAEYLILARLNRLKLWGGLALILALVTGLFTTGWIGLNPIGTLATLLYAVVGAVLLSSDQTITLNISGQQLIFSTRFGPIKRQTRAIPFSKVKSVYLDYEQYDYPNVGKTGQVERKWFIYLVLNNQQTVTLAFYQAIYATDQAPNLAKQTTAWDNLAQKICQAMDKLLIRTPGVPGRAPRTFIEVIDQIIQRRLTKLPETDPLANRTIRLRSHPNSTLEVIVDGAIYRELSDIADDAVRDFIQEAVDEWQMLNRREAQLS